MRRPLRILLSAGEASGDRLGAGLALALRRRRPEIELLGMGGERMAEAGVRLLQRSEEVAVVGISEVLAHLPAIRAARAKLARALVEERPDLFVPIDFPDFNLRLAEQARRTTVPVVYFVSPQIWAWRRGRVRQIRRRVRRMLVLFPFETAFYERAGVPVSCVGHPVLDRELPATGRAELCARAGLDPEREVVALLPGSRRSEVSRLLPILLDAAGLLQRERPGLQFLIPLAPGLASAAIEEPLRRSGLSGARVHAGDFPEILRACAAGAVTAGTASLEAAVVGLPMVVVYRMSLLSYAVGRALVRVPDVALPNLIAGRRIVPELIQGDCTPARIAHELAVYLEQPGRSAAARAALAEVRGQLGGPGIFDRAAEEVLAELGPGCLP